jgi:hypothetical protein
MKFTPTPDPVMNLVRASMSYAPERAVVGEDSPPRDVLLDTAKEDVLGGFNGALIHLALASGVAAACVTDVLADHQELPLDDLLAKLDPPDTDHTIRFIRILLGDDKADATGRFLGPLFHDDLAAFLTLILDLGRLTGEGIRMMEGLIDESEEELLTDLRLMLEEFVKS